MNFETRADLEAAGFEGFRTIRELQQSPICRGVPTKPGVYLVVRTTQTDPKIIKKDVLGKNKKPYSIDELRAMWVDGAIVLYIGKTGGEDMETSLKRRLYAYMRFGLHKANNHGGGKAIWQLADNQELLVCWRAELGDLRQIERDLIASFKTQYCKLPFANCQS